MAQREEEEEDTESKTNDRRVGRLLLSSSLIVRVRALRPFPFPTHFHNEEGELG